MTKRPTTVRGGKHYGVGRDGQLHEIDPGVRAPDVWVCRRVADCLGGVLPPGRGAGALRGLQAADRLQPRARRDRAQALHAVLRHHPLPDGQLTGA